MSATATLVSYLWHYTLARLLYDDLVRPLTHGHVTVALVGAAVAIGIAVLVQRRTGRRVWGRRRV